ncbi:MAG: cell division protein DivIC [Epulopiscium sp.]|jgi:cell division protein DivIC|nr:Septum formation initiator [Defluviitaleaceae bacterium]MDK2787396.1 cell division protein DivIC [Candidatus Epulonipiscium sp.]
MIKRGKEGIVLSRRKRQKKRFISWNVLFLAMFFGMIAFKTYDLQKINRGLEKQKAEYSEKIQLAQEEQELLLKEKEYIQSDIYVEKVAREKLGMVKEDEIVFMEKTE